MTNDTQLRNRFIAEVSALAASMALLATAVPNPQTAFERFVANSQSITVQAKTPGSKDQITLDIDTAALRASGLHTNNLSSLARPDFSTVEHIGFIDKILKANKTGIVSVSEKDQQLLVKSLAQKLRIGDLNQRVTDRLLQNSSKNPSNDQWIQSVTQYASGQSEQEVYKPKAPRATEKLIEKAAINNGIPPLLFKSLVEQESGYQKDMISPAGAVGLSQVMPSTALWLETGREKFTEVELNAMTERLKDPSYNLNVGSKYLASLINQFDGSLERSLAAYNAGPGAVQRAGGVPNYPETQKYVETIKARVLLKAHDAIEKTIDHDARDSEVLEQADSTRSYAPSFPR